MSPTRVWLRSTSSLRRVVDLRTSREGAALGRWLMLFSGLVYAATGWYVGDSSLHRSDLWVPVVLLIILVVAGVSRVVPWDDITPRATLAFPIIGLGIIGLVDYLAPTSAPAYLSMFTLWFLFIGVTQTPGTGWVFVLPAAAIWVEVSGGLNERNVVRVGLAMIVWGLAADLLAARERAAGQRHESLQQEAGTDPLTGLANRRSLQRTLDTLHPGDDVILLDLDHFKHVNDTRGHDGGDQVLIDFATMLIEVVRSGDVVARYGGEEFVLVLRRPRALVSANRTDEVADRAIVPTYVPSGALARLRTRWASLHPDITWSGGLCQHSDDRTVAQTMALADRALYEAKSTGRDRVVVSDGITG